MPRIPMIDPDGSRMLATEAGAEVLLERGYELADEVGAVAAEPEPEPEPEPETED